MIRLYLLGYKGLVSLKGISEHHQDTINDIVIGKDPATQNDYSSDIIQLCINKGFKYYMRGEEEGIQNDTLYSIAIGWRWLIKDPGSVIVFHDSLLPRLRGFNPLVTALINGDKETGVTALMATSGYDEGPVIYQQKLTLQYPVKIEQVISNIASLYEEISLKVISQIKSDTLSFKEQDHSAATYSLWRDEQDYFIDWSQNAENIKRFIDAVGFPYKGAKTRLSQESYTILDAEIREDVVIENRQAGKVIFKDNHSITVVCGTGLLKLTNILDEQGNSVSFPEKFRLRFY